MDNFEEVWEKAKALPEAHKEWLRLFGTEENGRPLTHAQINQRKNVASPTSNQAADYQNRVLLPALGLDSLAELREVGKMFLSREAAEAVELKRQQELAEEEAQRQAAGQQEENQKLAEELAATRADLAELATRYEALEKRFAETPLLPTTNNALGTLNAEPTKERSLNRVISIGGIIVIIGIIAGFLVMPHLPAITSNIETSPTPPATPQEPGNGQVSARSPLEATATEASTPMPSATATPPSASDTPAPTQTARIIVVTATATPPKTPPPNSPMKFGDEWNGGDLTVSSGKPHYWHVSSEVAGGKSATCGRNYFDAVAVDLQFTNNTPNPINAILPETAMKLFLGPQYYTGCLPGGRQILDIQPGSPPKGAVLYFEGIDWGGFLEKKAIPGVTSIRVVIPPFNHFNGTAQWEEPNTP